MRTIQPALERAILDDFMQALRANALAIESSWGDEPMPDQGILTFSNSWYLLLGRDLENPRGFHVERLWRDDGKFYDQQGLAASNHMGELRRIAAGRVNPNVSSTGRGLSPERSHETPAQAMEQGLAGMAGMDRFTHDTYMERWRGTQGALQPDVFVGSRAQISALERSLAELPPSTPREPGPFDDLIMTDPTDWTYRPGQDPYEFAVQEPRYHARIINATNTETTND